MKPAPRFRLDGLGELCGQDLPGEAVEVRLGRIDSGYSGLVVEMLNEASDARLNEIRAVLFAADVGVEARMLFLEQLGYADTYGKSYRLTNEGAHSVTQSAPPVSDEPMWAKSLLHAIAEHHRVEAVDLIRAEIGPAVVARARLCHALWARGWGYARIEEKFGFALGWAKAGVERWKRVQTREEPPGLVRTKKRQRRARETGTALEFAAAGEAP